MAVMDLYGSYLKGQQFAQNKAMQDADSARQQALNEARVSELGARTAQIEEAVRQTKHNFPTVSSLLQEQLKQAQTNNEYLPKQLKANLSLVEGQTDAINANLVTPDMVKRFTGYAPGKKVSGSIFGSLLANQVAKADQVYKQAVLDRQYNSEKERQNAWNTLVGNVGSADTDNLKNIGSEILYGGDPFSMYNFLTGQTEDTPRNRAYNDKIASEFIDTWGDYNFGSMELAPVYSGMLSGPANQLKAAIDRGDVNLSDDQKAKFARLQNLLGVFGLFNTPVKEGD